MGSESEADSLLVSFQSIGETSGILETLLWEILHLGISR